MTPITISPSRPQGLRMSIRSLAHSPTRSLASWSRGGHRARSLARVLTAFAALVLVSGCGDTRLRPPGAQVADASEGRVAAAGDSSTASEREAGRAELVRYGCGSCHTIPGIRGADAMVGPPLTAWGRRVFISGRLPNNRENLVHWIMEPQAVEPGTAMPNLGVSEREARAMAAYLEALR